MAFTPEERTLPLVTHVLMLLSVVTGFTALVAVLISYMGGKRATGIAQSHYEFVIHTFWIALIAMVALMAFAWSFTLFPFAFLPVYGRLLYLLVSIWVVVRSIVGIMRLTGGTEIINPETLLLPKPATA